MGTPFKKEHYGKVYNVEQLSLLTGKSARTFRRWRDQGHLKKMNLEGPTQYKVISPTENTSLNPISFKRVNIAELNTEPPDVTSEIEKSGGVSNFLKAAKAATEMVHLIHKPTDGRDKKILSISDIHCPFHNHDLIMSILEEHSDADAVVLNGDIIDAYGASSFSQDKLVTILEEYNFALDLIRHISNKFPLVALVRGNHDQRTDRYFSRKMDPHMFALAQRDILWKLANGYVYNDLGEHVGTVKMDNVIYNTSGQPWFIQIGKTVFMHPHSYSGKQMQTVVNAQAHLENFIDRADFDSVVIGHTHKVGKIIEKGKLLIEQGCLTKAMDYQKIGTYVTRPSSSGYAVIYQDSEGNTNFNDSTFVYEGVLNVMK